MEEKQAPTLHYLFNPWRRITAREHTHQQPIAMTPFFATKKMLVKVAFHLDFYITYWRVNFNDQDLTGFGRVGKGIYFSFLDKGLKVHC